MRTNEEIIDEINEVDRKIHDLMQRRRALVIEQYDVYMASLKDKKENE